MAKWKEVKKQKPRTNTQQMGQNLPWTCKRAGSEVSLAPGCVPTASRCKGFTEWAWTHVFVIHCSRNKLPQVRLGVPLAPTFMFCLTVKMSGGLFALTGWCWGGAHFSMTFFFERSYTGSRRPRGCCTGERRAVFYLPLETKSFLEIL